MKQAFAGVNPVNLKETTAMTVWPSVAAMSLGPVPLGLMLGRLYAIKTGVYIFTVGNLMCLLTIPLALILYLKRIGPFVAMRYRVTNKRIVVERGLVGKEEKAIRLDQFDTIEVVIRSGQEWYDAGDLVFREGNLEKFLLEGVSRPIAFRHICQKAHQAYVGVQAALERQSA